MDELDFSTLKILVIEDEPNTRRIIVQYLKQIGVQNIYEAPDGNSGFLETVRVRPHLVFCDVHMDPTSGLTYLAKLRGMPAVKAIPVIMLTADANEETVLTAKQHVVAGYLVKPVSAVKLKNRIEQVLSRKR